MECMIYLHQHYPSEKQDARAKVSGSKELVERVCFFLEVFTFVLRPREPLALTVSTSDSRRYFETANIKAPEIYSEAKFCNITFLGDDKVSRAHIPTPDPAKEGQGWVALMTGEVNDYDFDPYDDDTERPDGFVGLEIAFEDMKELANVTKEVKVKGRQALAGENVLLVPTKIVDKAIQWRCFSGEDRKQKAEGIVKDGDKTFSKLNWKKLSKYRNFVG